MKSLKFNYHMQIKFSSPVSDHRFTVKCIPNSDDRQEIEELKVSIFPDNSLSEGVDSFGNQCVYGNCEVPHEHFEIAVSGKAKVGIKPYEDGEKEHMIGRYRYPTEYTHSGEKINAYYDTFSFPADMDNYTKSLMIMRRLYEDFKYVSGATNIATTAEEALTLGCGVCQDYSHIMITLCRLEHIPARYVAGMLIGEGASHAWVEIYQDGKWYAFDPTNNQVVDDQHIKISCGRDYRDCLINQGVFVGNATQTQEIKVNVEEG